jgi:hypothetical protein
MIGNRAPAWDGHGERSISNGHSTVGKGDHVSTTAQQMEHNNHLLATRARTARFLASDHVAVSGTRQRGFESASPRAVFVVDSDETRIATTEGNLLVGPLHPVVHAASPDLIVELDHPGNSGPAVLADPRTSYNCENGSRVSGRGVVHTSHSRHLNHCRYHKLINEVSDVKKIYV